MVDCQAKKAANRSFHQHTISPTKRLTLFLLLLNLAGHITCFNQQNMIQMTLPVLGLSLKRLDSFCFHHFGTLGLKTLSHGVRSLMTRLERHVGRL